jgi:hypothetical protein
MPNLKNPRTIFLVLVAAYGLYAGAFIFRTSAYVEANSYVPESKRWYVLFDDMMISMTYAKNFANGDGLVWRPGGERVEGYTNPGWVLYMAFWHWTGIADESKISLIIQVSGAVFLALNLWVVKKIAGEISDQPLVMIGAVFFTAFYLPLNMWSLHGNEVSLLTLFVSLSTLWGLRMMKAGRFFVAPYLLLGVGAVIRMDAAVPLLALAGFLFFNQPQHRIKHLIAAPLSLLVFMTPQFVFRRWYYEDWLPNTYYLKMDGYPFVMRLTQGYEVTGRFFAKVGALPFAILIFRRDKYIRLIAWMLIAQVGYSIYVGGDAWEWYGGANRYISIAMPMFFILLWCMLVTLYTWIIEAARRLGAADLRFRVQPGAVKMGLGCAALILLVTYNYTYGTDALKEWLLIKPSMFAGENGDKVQTAYLLEALTTPDATIAISGAGIVPYFANRTFIDLLGKSDKRIGRGPAHVGALPEYVPGHMKWDYDYSIGQLDPDVVLELWMRAEDAGPYINEEYIPIWFPPTQRNIWIRQESPNVYWDRIWGR